MAVPATSPTALLNNTPPSTFSRFEYSRKETPAPTFTMPSTPQMRKANEKNAKNVTKRGNVVKSSKTDDKYPVSPELIVSSELLMKHISNSQFSISGSVCLRGDWICCVPNHPVCLDVWPLEY